MKRFVVYYLMAVVNFSLGYLVAIQQNIGVSILCGLIVGWAPLLCHMLLQELRKRKPTPQGLEPITKKTDEGYELNPADLYEAIERLGYYEHEMEKEVSKDARVL